MYHLTHGLVEIPNSSLYDDLRLFYGKSTVVNYLYCIAIEISSVYNNPHSIYPYNIKAIYNIR